jgi:hypothetical protein
MVTLVLWERITTTISRQMSLLPLRIILSSSCFLHSVKWLAFLRQELPLLLRSCFLQPAKSAPQHDTNVAGMLKSCSFFPAHT